MVLNPGHFECLPYLTHPIQVLEPLLMSWWYKLDELNKWDFQNVQCYRTSEQGLRMTVVKKPNMLISAYNATTLTLLKAPYSNLRTLYSQKDSR